jgi:hypothetical protein
MMVKLFTVLVVKPILTNQTSIHIFPINRHPLSNHFLLFTIFLNMGKYSPRDLGITMFVPPQKCTSGTRDLFIWTEDD